MNFRWPDGVKAAGKTWQPDPDAEEGIWYSADDMRIVEAALVSLVEAQEQSWQTGDMSPDGQWVLTTRGWASMDDILYEGSADFLGEDVDSNNASFPMTFGEAVEQGLIPGPPALRQDVPREVAEPTPWEHETAKRSFKMGYEQGYADAVEDATG